MFFLAADRGYFKAAGLDITFDQGSGSGAAVPLVADGTYDIGFGDVNALINFAARKPQDAPIAVAMLYNEPPFVIAVKTDSPIHTPKDLEGKTIGAPANDGALKLFPAFCKIAKIDCASVKMSNMQPNLREPMLMRGQVDGVFGYIDTIRFAAKNMKIDPDKQLRFIRYSDYGMDLYSNAIIVSPRLAKEHPEAVRGFLAALFKGINDTIKNPDAAIQALIKREPLLNASLEKEKLLATMATEMSAPEIATIGLGAADPKRLSKSIGILVDAEKLPATPKVSQIFDASFLPPLADRPKSMHPHGTPGG
ncbi:MAG TPA: ABC transporter substrate-binding protein [Rhodopila sp.]|nr:ABC transporter substrate-binding protein [Rhodopila sp.]